MAENRQNAHGSDDDFWNLDLLLPQKRPQAAVPGDTTTTELFQDGAAVARPRPIPRAVPGARQTPRTPGDVRPPMSEPVCSYVPENSLLQKVSVWRWPARFHYFDRFLSDAERYFNRADAPCDYVPFYAYLPQYHLMTPEQASYYFYWRACVRQGEYPRCDYSYLFLYLYEIINLPDKIAPADGADAMARLWLAYRDSFPRLDRYIGEWLCDYCLIYQLPAPTAQLRPILGELFDKVSLKEFYVRLDRSAESPFTPALCDALSDYDWRASRYLTDENRPLFETHLYGAVLTLLAKLWRQSGSEASLLGLTEVLQTRDAFSGALCTFNVKRRIDLSLLSVSRSYPFRCLLTDACRFAENSIRAHLGIKARMSCPALGEDMRVILRAYFEAELPSRTTADRARRKAERAAEKDAETVPEYAHYYEPEQTPLSAGHAREIEEQSWETTDLLTAEPEPETVPVPQPIPQPQPQPQPAENDDPYAAFVGGLCDDDYEALKCVINGDRDAFASLAARRLLLPAAQAERLNTQALECTGDTVLDADDNGAFFHLSDYYANEITDAVVAREERT